MLRAREHLGSVEARWVSVLLIQSATQSVSISQGQRNLFSSGMHIDGNEACEAWRHCSHLSIFNHDVASSFFGLAGSCKVQPARTRIIRNTKDISRPCLPARIVASRSAETQLLRRDCSRVSRDCLHTQLQPYAKAVLDSLNHLQPATSPCKLFERFI